ncbi:hypothetical protein WUBG_14198, partial [Wuchereria bancrofti]
MRYSLDIRHCIVGCCRKLPFSGIFGYHLVTASDRRIVLTTNERDALAVFEATGGMLCVALPKGEQLDVL